MNQFTTEEYARMIVSNILSGSNACGTLQKAVEQRDSAYFEKMATPVIERIAAQLQQAEMERDKANSDRNKAQFALETFIQNLFPTQKNPNVLSIRKTEVLKKIVNSALGRDAFIDTPRSPE